MSDRPTLERLRDLHRREALSHWRKYRSYVAALALLRPAGETEPESTGDPSSQETPAQGNIEPLRGRKVFPT